MRFVHWEQARWNGTTHVYVVIKSTLCILHRMRSAVVRSCHALTRSIKSVPLPWFRTECKWPTEVDKQMINNNDLQNIYMMLLWRPFLIEFESGNVLFEEMEKPEYQEKTPRINRRACTKTQLPLAACECFYHCAAPARQSRGLGGAGAI